MSRPFLYIDNGETKICSKCNKEKPIKEFRKIKNKTLLRADCKSCEKIYDDNYKKNNRIIIRIKAKKRYRKNLLDSMLGNAKGRAKKNNLKFDLDLEYLKILWDKCDGRCELSNILFESEVFSKPHPFRPSLDRINNSKGYIKGNVRIILWALNRAINDTGFEIYYKIAKEVITNNDHIPEPGNMIQFPTKTKA